MSDYELLTVVLMFLGIIVSILIAYINTKSNRHLPDLRYSRDEAEGGRNLMEI